MATLGLVTSDLVGALADASPVELPSVVEATLSAIEGVSSATIWLSDLGYTELRHLGSDESISVEGTLPGRCFLEKRVEVLGSRLVAPIDSSGRTLGVLELRGEGVEATREVVAQFGSVIADRLLGLKGHSDLIEIARGAASLDIAATIQRELLPVPSFKDPTLEIGGEVEPAYEIAGDAFDYAVNDGDAWIGLFDAVGHGLRSAVLTNVAVGTFRLSRRRRESVVDTVAAIDASLDRLTSSGEFVTGVLGHFTVSTRQLEIAVVGHLPPIVTRDGKAQTLAANPMMPFGLGKLDPKSQRVSLQPGDAIYLYSDGIVEAHDRDRVTYGEVPLLDALSRHEQEGTPVQRVCRAVLSDLVAYVGSGLSDDATILGMRTAEK